MSKGRKEVLPKLLSRVIGTFEFELLLELMFRFWHHPRADDSEYRSAILESVANVLDASATGQLFFTELPPREMNFVAAVWYVETIETDGETNESIKQKRVDWLNLVRKSLPSCFCAQDLLGN